MLSIHRDSRVLQGCGALNAAGKVLAVLLAIAGFTGCVRYHARPLAAAQVAADFESRSLADAGLRTFLETNRVTGDWPRRVWELESLTLAAFYFSPELDE